MQAVAALQGWGAGEGGLGQVGLAWWPSTFRRRTPPLGGGTATPDWRSAGSGPATSGLHPGLDLSGGGWAGAHTQQCLGTVLVPTPCGNVAACLYNLGWWPVCPAHLYDHCICVLNTVSVINS